MCQILQASSSLLSTSLTLIKLDQPRNKKENGYVIGELTEELLNGKYRGWLCGHFYPEDSPFHRNDIEVCIKDLHEGFVEEAHHHLCSFEMLFILSGEVIYCINEDLVTLRKNSFYILNPCTPEHLVEVKKQARILCIRLPSVPKNKILH